MVSSSLRSKPQCPADSLDFRLIRKSIIVLSFSISSGLNCIRFLYLLWVSISWVLSFTGEPSCYGMHSCVPEFVFFEWHYFLFSKIIDRAISIKTHTNAADFGCVSIAVKKSHISKRCFIKWDIVSVICNCNRASGCLHRFIPELCFIAVAV